MSTTPLPRPRHRRLTTAVLATGLVGALSVSGTATAGAAELPTGTDLQSGPADAVNDSLEYGGYVVGSVQEFFRLPVDQAVAGSIAAGALALCLLLPTPPVPDGTCVI